MKKLEKLKYSLLVKLLALIGVIIFSILFVITVFMGYFIWETNLYGKSKDDVYDTVLGNMAEEDARNITETFVNYGEEHSDYNADMDDINITIYNNGNMVYEKNNREGSESIFTYQFYHWQLEYGYMQQFDNLGEYDFTVEVRDGKLFLTSIAEQTEEAENEESARSNYFGRRR